MAEVKLVKEVTHTGRGPLRSEHEVSMQKLNKLPFKNLPTLTH